MWKLLLTTGLDPRCPPGQFGILSATHKTQRHIAKSTTCRMLQKSIWLCYCRLELKLHKWLHRWLNRPAPHTRFNREICLGFFDGHNFNFMRELHFCFFNGFWNPPAKTMKSQDGIIQQIIYRRNTCNIQKIYPFGSGPAAPMRVKPSQQTPFFGCAFK